MRVKAGLSRVDWWVGIAEGEGSFQGRWSHGYSTATRPLDSHDDEPSPLRPHGDEPSPFRPHRDEGVAAP